jgi:hypothetical protein
MVAVDDQTTHPTAEFTLGQDRLGFRRATTRAGPTDLRDNTRPGTRIQARAPLRAKARKRARITTPRLLQPYTRTTGWSLD